METSDDSHCQPEIIRAQRVAVFGFGAQGRAQAANLRDSGVEVVLGLRPGSASRAAAEAAGFDVRTPEEAAGDADVAVLLVPDLVQAELYRDALAPGLRSGAALVFAHGYAIHHGLIQARADLDVVLVAPLGIGEQVRSQYLDGGGVPGLIAVAQDASGEAWALAASYAWAQGHGRAAIMRTSFAEETETDLFAEQAVLVGGLSELIRAGYTTLVEAGYDPRIAYLSCVNEVKLLADLIYKRGIAGMQASISDVAAFGGHTQGPRVIGPESRAAMRAILDEVRSGRFAEALAADVAAGGRGLAMAREAAAAEPIESVGQALRDAADDAPDGEQR